ncbi:MAG: winged helix-turn-helix domain-containing protein [Woeseia sp.]
MVKRHKKGTDDSRDDFVFKAMAGPERRRILDLLRESPQTTGAICKHFPSIDRCTVMQHLRVLEEARLVISRKSGRCRWNYLDVTPIQRIHQRWIKDYAIPAATLLMKLQEDLEGGDAAR